MKITHMLLTSAILLGLTNAAYANHHAGEEGEHCEHADTNKDGTISREDFMMKHQKRAEKMFSRMDTNKDGKIDANERKAAHAAMEHHSTTTEKK
ncbi:Calcium-binding EF-hand-containing protein [Methylotenera mobilis JLW8]|uniref:Calcium-binding EF-hand-containing protein n=2 Tax=Methylotenera mobilis TaxID=359408 RepID=C6WXW2_METML|nr:Calcium-binding EF-hand-containing protein [Methylotenera mobilis JLW8]